MLLLLLLLLLVLLLLERLEIHLIFDFQKTANYTHFLTCRNYCERSKIPSPSKDQGRTANNELYFDYVNVNKTQNTNEDVLRIIQPLQYVFSHEINNEN